MIGFCPKKRPRLENHPNTNAVPPPTKRKRPTVLSGVEDEVPGLYSARYYFNGHKRRARMDGNRWAGWCQTYGAKRHVWRQEPYVSPAYGATYGARHVVRMAPVWRQTQLEQARRLVSQPGPDIL